MSTKNDYRKARICIKSLCGFTGQAKRCGKSCKVLVQQNAAIDKIPLLAIFKRHCLKNSGSPVTDENEQGSVYLGELETMLASLVKFNENDDVIKEAKALQARLAEHFSQ